MGIHPTEEATVRAFIIASKRDRYVLKLVNAKARSAFLDVLNHCYDFDTRYATALPSTVDVPFLLQSHGAPPTCNVISDYPPIDGQQLLLADAVFAAASSGTGTLLCCVPGRLAFYIGEVGEQRLLLKRPAA